MITLADLAALQHEHADAWSSTVDPVVLAGPAGDVVIGEGPVTLMGCINLSRDSTYRESVATSPPTPSGWAGSRPPKGRP
ncbi:hypothetical protein [Nocardioides piscis]|uniref:Uncharacterized protein n=1 Tax=Nocardioides piscis TaxID=2714938 RepID=A0A6G7YF20_9ACTN|nr:hypothetical protein [Nocardioides piscis]QIK75276.1 hypothetical protein G7071_07365 [Nocardioides piscis]